MTAVIMLITAVTAFADFDASITDFSLNDGIVTMHVSKTTDAEARGVAAVYSTSGILKRLVLSDTVSGTGDKQLSFNDSIVLSDNEIIKVFLWSSENGELTLKPLSDMHVPSGQPTLEPKGDGIIHLLGDSINADGIENVTVDGTTATITAAGEYTVEGTLNDGQLIVNSADKKDKIAINLNGVSITSASGNAIDGQTGKVTLVPIQDNTLKSDADTGTAIYSKHDLTIKGQGSITAVSKGNGIRCKNDIEIGECDLNVTAGNNGIKGDQSVKITKKNRTITVVSDGDGIKSDQLPVLDETTGEYTVGGTITVNGGNINITAKSTTDADGNVSSGEGIQADTLLTVAGGTIDITSDGDGIQCAAGDVMITGGDITVNSQQDCIQSENVTNISGGTFDLTAYNGAPQTASANNAEAANSCKGVKAANLVYISGGTFNINTYDDAVHSNNTVRILGGSITAATGDDGIHGDSYLYISDSADIDITKSYEGIEAAKIYISGGETRVVSSDDGANAAGDEPTDEAVSLDSEQASEILLFAGPDGQGGFGGGSGGPNWGGEDILLHMVILKCQEVYCISKQKAMALTRTEVRLFRAVQCL